MDGSNRLNAKATPQQIETQDPTETVVNYGQLCTYLFFRRGHPGSAVFHCILQPLTLHICDGSLTALQPLTISAWFSAMAKQNQNKKTQNQETKKQKNKKKQENRKKKNDKTQLSATTPPLGVCNLVFFWFVVFLFFGFLGFWFVVGLSAMAKQNQNPKKTRNQKTKKQTTPKKMARPNSLPLLPPWGVQSRFLFFWFICFFGFLFF